MFLRRTAVTAVATAAALVSAAGLTAQAGNAATLGGHPYSHVSSAPPVQLPGSLKPPGSAGGPPRQEFVPDLIGAVPTGIASAQLARIRKLSGVQAVLAVDGGEITVNGRRADVLGVSPEAFRSWTPPSTAAAVTVWAELGKGQLITTAAAARGLHLTAGHSYTVAAATVEQVPFGEQAALSVPGVDAIVDGARSAQLGLVKNVAVLINAPGADLATLMSEVKSVIGNAGQVRNLVPYVILTPSKLPVTTNVPVTGVPSSYLDLYQESAETCPGLSWTVLAAIGEVESGDGANDGPSTAGALGPMQFLPSTWAIWGTDGFGQTGTPNIMNPLDAVPSAARMLCADGAGNSVTLPQAIFDYNPAIWYVNEVLALASEYARNYRS
jgi:Transglycosylase SLT domain